MSNVSETTQLQVVMGYAAQLELEVDRLRRRDQFLQHSAHEHVKQTMQLCKSSNESARDMSGLLSAVTDKCTQFGELLEDMHETHGYHPAFDQVVSIAIRPLAEKVFRWHQRLCGIREAVLRFDLEPEYIDWFPARLRHILDNLISNALRFRDPAKGEIRVGLALRRQDAGYELRFTDNGKGISGQQATSPLELFYRAAPTRAAGLGVGLAVVKFLVEQCCGTISINGGAGRGTSVTVVLPRYDLDDHVCRLP